MHVRSSSNAINFRHFLQELCSFLTSNSYKYAVFRTFLLHALTYWVQILYMTLYHRASLSVVNLRQFWLELCPFSNLEYWKYTVFRTFLLHPLTYWAESLHITLFFCTTDQVWVSSICVYFGVMPLFEYCKYSFLHFSLTRFDIWYWAEILHMTLFYCTAGQLQVSSLGINFCRSNVPLGLTILEIHSFLHFSPAFFDILSWNFSYNFA